MANSTLIMNDVIINSELSNNVKLFYVYTCIYASQNKPMDIEYYKEQLNITNEELNDIIEEVLKFFGNDSIDSFLKLN